MKMVLNWAQDLKKKSQEVSAQKKITTGRDIIKMSFRVKHETMYLPRQEMHNIQLVQSPYWVYQKEVNSLKNDSRLKSMKHLVKILF